MGEPWHWSVYSELLYSVKTGKVAWERVHGKEVFPICRASCGIRSLQPRDDWFLDNTLPALVRAYDFAGVRKLADIAGGHGMLLTGFLKANPRLQVCYLITSGD